MSAKTLALIQPERERPLASGDKQVLPSIQHVRLRRVRDAADPRVPDRFAGGGIVGDDVAAAIPAEDETPGGRQHPAAASAVIAKAWIRAPPRDLSAPRI